MKNMPKTLKTFLSNLTEKQAIEIWLYLDATPHAATAMIDLMLREHPNVRKQWAKNPKPKKPKRTRKAPTLGSILSKEEMREARKAERLAERIAINEMTKMDTPEMMRPGGPNPEFARKRN